MFCLERLKSMTSRFFLIITMSLTKQQKGEILKKLVKQIKDAKSVIFANYQGITVNEMRDFRKQMRKIGADFKIAKKTLMRIAAKEAGFDEIPDAVLEGPVGAAFCIEDEIAPASFIYQFSKKNKNLKLRGALFEGRVLSVAETTELAQLPGKEELLGKFVYLVNYPIQGFYNVLNNTLSGFVRALNEVKKQKEQTA